MTITTLKKSYLIMIIKATVMFSSLKKMERKKVSFRLNQFYFRDFTPLSNEIYCDSICRFTLTKSYPENYSEKYTEFLDIVFHTLPKNSKDTYTMAVSPALHGTGSTHCMSPVMLAKGARTEFTREKKLTPQEHCIRNLSLI